MEQLNIPKIKEIISKIHSGNKRILELFTTRPAIKVDVYKKTAYFYAERKYEEAEKNNRTIPHGFYQILEQEINNFGLVKTLKKYEKELKLISTTMNVSTNDLIKWIKTLKNNSYFEPVKTKVARDKLKEIIKTFTSKYKEAFIKKIYEEKLELLAKNTKINPEIERVRLIPIETFINLYLNIPNLRESLENLIYSKLGIFPTEKQLEETIKATFETDYMSILKDIYKIKEPTIYPIYEKNKTYNRLKRNYEKQFNERFSSYSIEDKENIIRVLEAKTQPEAEKTGNELSIIKARLKANIPHDDQVFLENISTLIKKAGCTLKLVNGKFIFTIEYRTTKEENNLCQEYISKCVDLKKIHNSIYSYYQLQNKLINNTTSKKEEVLSGSDDNYQINTDIWLTEDKIASVIASIDKEKLDNLSLEHYNLLKKFLLEDGFLWAYISDNIDLKIFSKIVNNFESIASCTQPSKITIDNLKNLIKMANLYDYASNIIIGLVGPEIAAKVINYNQFSGTNITDEVIHARLRKLVDLTVRSESVNTSSLPFNCNIDLGDYRLIRYLNNDPELFTCGVDTKTCFFISVNENDFFFYSVLNKNGYVIKIVDKNNNLLARASCFRRNNILMINGIRCKNNKVNTTSKEETDEMINIIKLVRLMAQKLIELTSKDECPIDYVVCNKAGILDNSEIDEYFKFENINADLFREPINIYNEDWKEFIHTYDNQEQLLQEVPFEPKKSFTTDFGNHYPALLISSSNNKPLCSLRNISLNDQPATYIRPRRSPEEYIGGELTNKILARINRIRALSCFIGSKEETIKKQKEYQLISDPTKIKNTIIGEDWCIIIYHDNQYEIFIANNNKQSKEEIKKYISVVLHQKTDEYIDGVKIYKK